MPSSDRGLCGMIRPLSDHTRVYTSCFLYIERVIFDTMSHGGVQRVQNMAGDVEKPQHRPLQP